MSHRSILTFLLTYHSWEHRTDHVSKRPRRVCYLVTLSHTLTSAQESGVADRVSILNSIKSTEISNIVKALSQDAQDTLMKYLYKGMVMPG
ncbi:uncharacterized protein EDB91DRAFT_1061968 [Suillus paluster]|uniref:uncharacterized protein n=1 Tax=Suillus paluster TaxID=48578 RepID=UPI001B868679|nr:uncharacterized protein EDB91DRAFT_1061968 [Suillus paluster]KAG1725808.1 hypothetical protein EDB91DRAFT_1061968 [Suillus paluster]